MSMRLVTFTLLAALLIGISFYAGHRHGYSARGSWEYPSTVIPSEASRTKHQSVSQSRAPLATDSYSAPMFVGTSVVGSSISVLVAETGPKDIIYSLYTGPRRVTLPSDRAPSINHLKKAGAVKVERDLNYQPVEQAVIGHQVAYVLLKRLDGDFAGARVLMLDFAKGVVVRNLFAALPEALLIDAGDEIGVLQGPTSDVSMPGNIWYYSKATGEKIDHMDYLTMDGLRTIEFWNRGRPSR